MKKVLLKSFCNVKGSEGQPGDVVTFKDDKVADRIIAGRGGVEAVAEKKGEAKE